jgi:hypothetical protein
MAAAGGSCQEMEPAVDFAVHVGVAATGSAGPRKARRPAAPFPATHPRGVSRPDVPVLRGGRYVAVGGPNQVVSASVSPGWVRSPTQATYPSGRITTAAGAVTAPSAGSSHVPAYFASID